MNNEYQISDLKELIISFLKKKSILCKKQEENYYVHNFFIEKQKTIYQLQAATVTVKADIQESQNNRKNICRFKENS